MRSRTFDSINWQGMIDEGSLSDGYQTYDQNPGPWQPQQPAQLFPFRANRPPRVDNSNQPWYGSRNRSWGKGPAEASVEASAVADQNVDALIQNPVTTQGHNLLSDVWDALNSFFHSLSNTSLKTTDADTSPNQPLPIDQTQWAIEAQDSQYSEDTNSITSATGGIYG